jgi:acyl-CoA synthetase (AMP-forming)/AMP-acid ligase II
MPVQIPLLPMEFSTSPALADDSTSGWVTYDELRARAADWAQELAGPRGLVIHYIRNDVTNVVALLGAIAAGHAVVLTDPALPAVSRARLEKCYRPEWVLEPLKEVGARRVSQSDNDAIHPDLALMLSTSGSTGSPKLARFALSAIEANAGGIAEVLGISSSDVAAGHLQLHYSYGLSVLTSHLVMGARVRLTEFGLMQREFWPGLREAGVTHLPGVPFHYQILAKLGFGRLGLNDLRSMTQAGGAMSLDLRRQAHAFMAGRGGSFCVLYGQTEAAPRMTTLRHEDFPLAEESVGHPLPGCRIDLADADETGAGEVVFAGPNVMMGYAESRADLVLGDVQNGRLLTGDIGRLDSAGRLFLVGRSKRFGKIHGLRVNLDEIEREANIIVPAAAVQTGDRIRIYFVGSGDEKVDEGNGKRLLECMLSQFSIPRASFELRAVAEIPLTQRAKVDYRALEMLQ